jgi:hypothetical protein
MNLCGVVWQAFTLRKVFLIAPAAGIEQGSAQGWRGPGPRGAEATLGATASPLGQPLPPAYYLRKPAAAPQKKKENPETCLPVAP